jgi:hypothetical protein
MAKARLPEYRKQMPLPETPIRASRFCGFV